MALARNLATVLHRIWADGTEFGWGKDLAAAAAAITPRRHKVRSGANTALAGAEQRGEVAVQWHPTGEYILDELAHRLLDAVRRRGVRRLLIDGVSGFQQAALEPERIVRFWSALSHELRALGVTTMHTLEMPTLTGVDIQPPGSDISALAEAMVLLRYVELRSRLCRLISLSKVRVGAFDPTIRRVLDHQRRRRRRQTIRGCPGRSGQRST